MTPDAVKNIRCLCLDVDGILTDGRLYYNEQGEVLKVFHVHDGYALKVWHAQSYSSLIISGRNSAAMSERAAELGIDHVFQGVTDKLAKARLFCEETGTDIDTMAALGDDWPDLALMGAVGLSLSVADARPEVRQQAHYVTEAKGGTGAVAEAIYEILRLQGVHFHR